MVMSKTWNLLSVFSEKEHLKHQLLPQTLPTPDIQDTLGIIGLGIKNKGLKYEGKHTYKSGNINEPYTLLPVCFTNQIVRLLIRTMLLKPRILYGTSVSILSLITTRKQLLIRNWLLSKILSPRPTSWKYRLKLLKSLRWEVRWW